MSKFNLSAAVQAQLDAVASAAADAFVADKVSWEPVAFAFGQAVEEADIPTIKNGEGVIVGADWESEGGKAVVAYISPKILTALSKNKYYDVAVHRVGSGDEYLPIDEAHPANYTITGAFAVTANLNDLASVKERPNGMKAWLRGGVIGERPDGDAKGLRDKINNNKDQVVRRLRNKENERRQAPTKKDFVDKLLDLYKGLKGARDKYEEAGNVCANDAEFKTLCMELADKALKRQPKKSAK
jgi:hypothetical protein